MKLRNIVMISLILILSNLGLLYALAEIYNPVSDSGYIRLDISDVDMTFFDPDYNTGEVNKVFLKSREIIKDWSNSYSAKIFYKDNFSFESASYYYFPKDDSNEIASQKIYGLKNNKNLYSMLKYDDLIETMYETPIELAEELEPMQVFKGDIFFPFSQLTRFQGFLYIENKGETVLDLYDNLSDVSLIIQESRDEILPKGKIQNMLELFKSEGVETKAILISIFINIFTVAFISLLIVENSKYDIKVRRVFGLSRIGLIISLALHLSLILLISSFFSLVMAYRFLSFTRLEYVFSSAKFLIVYSFVVIILIFLLLICYELRGEQNE